MGVLGLMDGTVKTNRNVGVEEERENHSIGLQVGIKLATCG